MSPLRLYKDLLDRGLLQTLCSSADCPLQAADLGSSSSEFQHCKDRQNERTQNLLPYPTDSSIATSRDDDRLGSACCHYSSLQSIFVDSTQKHPPQAWPLSKENGFAAEALADSEVCIRLQASEADRVHNSCPS